MEIIGISTILQMAVEEVQNWGYNTRCCGAFVFIMTAGQERTRKPAHGHMMSMESPKITDENSHSLSLEKVNAAKCKGLESHCRG